MNPADEPARWARRRLLAAGAAVPIVGMVPTTRAAASPAATLVVSDDSCRWHTPPEWHREQADRLDAVLTAIAPLADAGRIRRQDGRAATEADLRLVHSGSYLEVVRRDIAEGSGKLSTGDTRLSERSYEASAAAAGCGIVAVDAVLEGRTRNAFCAVRPPGHHASAERGMGFGIFNTIAIAARHAQRRHGVARILIVDWDVHHGNGTQATFWTDGGVLFFDTHQDPWYPGTGMVGETGEGRGAGLIVNRPLPEGTGRREVLSLYRETLMPAAERFRPELVLISAGFDSRLGDPLGRFTLVEPDFADMTRIVLDIADRHAGGRCVSILEGGYNLEGLGSAAAAHVSELARA
jgi:acetoin utilization deacetylase AcuC-like enzyme